MDIRYELTLRIGVYDALSAMSPVYRKRFLEYMEQLMANPFMASDFTEKDEDGAYLETKIIGKYVIFYALDHAVKEIRVLKIVEANRA